MATTINNNAVAARKRKRTNWSSVPLDVLGVIATNISSVEDYFVFGAVCKWWRCAANQNKTSIDLNCQKTSPWLMKIYHMSEEEPRVFYSLARDKHFNIDLPEIRGRQCFGSPFGWLITFRLRMLPLRVDINLFNPLSKAYIPLPDPVHNLDCSGFSVYKAILTATPASLDCSVLMRYRYGSLAFARPGDHVWTPIQTPKVFWKDIICFKGNVYGCEFNGRLSVFDLSNPPNVAAVAFAPSPRELSYPDNHSNFLVELGTELCLVIMFTKRTSDYKKFEIYRIDMETREWTRVESLGQWCLVFEDDVTFFSVDPVAAEHNKLIPGCIYCANSDGSATKVWNVEKRRLLRWHSHDDIYSRLYPTTRITPSLLLP